MRESEREDLAKNKLNNGTRSVRLYRPKARSKITNRGHLPHLDNRTLWPRRLRDLIALISEDLGGFDTLSEARKAIIKRAAVIICELEQRELHFAEQGATDLQLEQYSRVAGNLRRMLESIGLDRVPKDITPTLREYMEAKAEAAE